MGKKKIIYIYSTLQTRDAQHEFVFYHYYFCNNCRNKNSQSIYIIKTMKRPNDKKLTTLKTK